MLRAGRSAFIVRRYVLAHNVLYTYIAPFVVLSCGGVLGAMTITMVGPGALPWSAAGLLVIALMVVLGSW